MATGTASATSLNFLGFDDMKGFGTPPLRFRSSLQAETAGVNALAAVGFLPGQQNYIKQRRAIWSKSKLAQMLERQGYRTVYM